MRPVDQVRVWTRCQRSFCLDRSSPYDVESPVFGKAAWNDKMQKMTACINWGRNMVETTRAHAGPSLDAKNEIQEKSVSLLLDDLVRSVWWMYWMRSTTVNLVKPFARHRFGPSFRRQCPNAAELPAPSPDSDLCWNPHAFRFVQKTTSISSRGVLRCMHPSTWTKHAPTNARSA